MKILFVISLLISSFGLYAQDISILPKPNYIEKKQGHFYVNEQTTISFSSGLNKESKIIQDYFFDIAGLQVQKTSNNISNNISLKVNPSLNKEAYKLFISPQKVLIEGGTNTGVFYAWQSIKQLLLEDNSTFSLPALIIKDEPRFKWRQYMLDEAHYFHGEKFVKKILDQMALLKMNKFHWHLTDDAGWRIEIKKYPLLTTIGGFRKDTEVETWKSGKTAGEPHGGFYTQEQIKRIVAYANDRHISIIPEFEMPGHASAAIASYTWLGTAGVPIEVPAKFGRLYDNFDVTNPKVIKFFKDVLLEMFEMFPSEVIHIGGDEVGYKVWEESDHVQKYMKDHGIKTPADLQVIFTNKMSKFIESHGRRMMGWNEILGKNIHTDFVEKKHDRQAETELAKNTIVHFWKGDTDLARDAAQQGYGIVNSLHEFAYLDYGYTTTSLEKAYRFDPVPAGLEEKYHKNIYGLGTQMWSEWTPKNADVEFQTFPRIAAHAETGWTQVENKDFIEFKKSLKKMQEYWQSVGINYAKKTAGTH
ncbi:MAG: beta-N-acetylhexosaminidase [Pseudoalteromonas nigrifaciens]